MADPRPTRATDPDEPRPLLGVVASIGAAAGAPVTLRVAVTNAAAGPRVLTLTAVGVDPAWVDGPARTDVLEAGASAVVELRLTAPVGTLPARYPLVLAAQALDPASGRPTTSSTGVAETVLVVNPRAQLSVELEPRELPMISSRRFGVRIQNSGGAPTRVELQLRGSTHVVLGLRRTVVDVPAGETVTVRGRARVARPRVLGAKAVHPFTLTARGTESVRHVDGRVLQRAVVGPVGVKAVALLAVLAVWAAAAIVFLPALAEKISTSSEEETSATLGSEEAGEDGAGEDGGSGEDGAGGEDSEDGEDGGAGGPAGEGVQLLGTVASDDPGDVSVQLRPTSLVDEEAQTGVGVGVPSEDLDGSGMRPAAAFVRSAPDRRVAPRSVVTEDDGSWAFPAVRAPGYYLLTFSKPGFQTQRFVMDASSAAAAEPLDVELEPGEGALSGRITGPGGAVGGAAITITDGTHTLTTTSTSQGDVGSWSVDGLSTPSTYVVQATKHGMSSEARAVTLDASGTGTASLELVPGVATLSGKISGAGLEGDPGLAGITVAVSDGDGGTRTATTLTRPRGLFAVPGLPAPGSYTVTVSGEGYQSKTTELELGRGQAAADLDLTLRASSGSVGGVIRARASTPGSARRVTDGLPNAGMTLSNAEHTYKTTSTSQEGASPEGTYELDGVAPGTYVLTTQYFGMVTDHVTVVVEPGGSETVNRTLVEDDGAGLPATAPVWGSVVDASTGLALADCPAARPLCLEATVDEPGVVKDDGVTPDLEYSMAFAPDTGYELPNPDDFAEGESPGLRPGLHTVRVTAPGYEAGSVDVEVRQGERTEAPLVELFPAPVVTGTVGAVVNDDPEGDLPTTCVWVVEGNRTAGDLAAELPTCTDSLAADAPAADVCVPGDAAYDGTNESATRWCASTLPDGSYRVQVPEPGTYTVAMRPLDVEYVAPAPESVVLAHGGTREKNVVLDRYGRLDLRVMAPDLSDRLAPAEGVEVEVSPAPEVDTAEPTRPDGWTTVSGLRDRQTYTFAGAVVVPVDPAETGTSRTTMTGSLQAAVPYNEVRTATLRLVNPLPGFVGLVTARVDDRNERLPGATAVVKAAHGFAVDGTPTYGETFSVGSDAVGCFAIDSVSPPKRGTACARPDHPADGTRWDAGTLVSRQVVTNRAASIRVSAPGYVTRTWEQKAFSVVNATELTLAPSPVSFGATVTLEQGPGTAPTPAWAGAKVEVDPTSSEVGSVSSTLVAGPTGTTGSLTWSWTDRAGVPQPAGTVLPGTYSVAVSLPGYEPATGVLACAPRSTTGCTWETGLVLQRLGTITVEVLDGAAPSTTAVKEPVVTKHHDGATLQKTGDVDGVVTFSDITPGTGTDHQFHVRAAGFAFGRTDDPSGDVTMSCDQGSPAGKVTVRAGDETVCTVRLLHPLGTLGGTLRGQLGPQGDTGDVFEHLTGVRVTAQQCVDTTCTSLKGPVRTSTTTLANTATGDRGGVFTFRGDAAVQGLDAGTYLLKAVPPAGFVVPSGGLGGTKVTLADREHKTDGHAYLYAEPVDVAVKVVDQHGKVVTDATSVQLTKETPPAGPLASDPVATRTGSGEGTRYRFSDVVPGDWTVWAAGPGFRGASVTARVTSSATGTASELTLVATRTGASVGGVVDTLVGASSTKLDGVRVVLTCDPGTTTPPAFCGAGPGDPAKSTGGADLVTTTGPAGGYTFPSVPAGTFTATFSKVGYQTATAPVVVDDLPRTISVSLTGVSRTVKVVLAPSNAADSGLSATRLDLVPVGSTPGTTLTVGSLALVDGTWTGTFSGVRWGCYRLDVVLPAGHHGNPVGPDVSPAPPGDFACPAGADVVVPDTSTAEITVRYGLAEGPLAYTLTTAPWSGHAVPATRIRVDGPGTADDFVIEAAPTSGTLWLPPGDWTLTSEVPDADAPYWDATGSGAVAVSGTAPSPAAASLGLSERTFRVTISVLGLAAGEEADLRISAGLGQTGALPVPSQLTTTGGTTYVDLPRGKWLVEGDWDTGPDAVVVDVVPCGRNVVLGAAPATSVPVACAP